MDSVCAFDFETKNWTKLGPINPELKKMIDRDNFYTLHLGKLFLFRRFFDWHWVDFENNLFGNLKIEKNSEAKQKWLNLYNTKSTYQDLQFNLGNTCYLIKLDPDLNTSYASFTISKEDIDLTEADYIYKKNNFILAFYYTTVVPFFTPNVYILIIASFFIFFVLYRQRKKRVPKEVSAILNYNFVNSLTIIEKELVQVFAQFSVDQTIQWFKQNGVSLITEEDGRMFPLSNSSDTIVNCFLNLAKKYNIFITFTHHYIE